MAEVEDTCPQCDMLDCHPTFEARGCPDDTMFEENVIWGCCPACVKYLDFDEICVLDPAELLAQTEVLSCQAENQRRFMKNFPIINGEGDIPMIKFFECGQGYLCNDTTSRCENVDVPHQCAQDQEAFKDWFDDQAIDNSCTRYDWEKSCTPRGYYQKQQAKYSQFIQERASRKFCVDLDGNRIFGDASVNDEDMTCKCSRKVWELRQGDLGKRGDDVTIHCTSNGNFENLQCDQGRCWCVDSRIGHVISRVVHKDLVQYLSCYSTDTFGEQYRRRCESRRYGKSKAIEIMRHHGLSWNQDDPYACDYDGSFARVNCKKEFNRCGCVDKANNWIGTYSDADSLVREFGCLCARDKMVDDTIGLDCDKRGNYEAIQQFNTPAPGTEFCVDESGFQVTPKYSMSTGITDKRCLIPNCPARHAECFGKYENGTQYDNGLCKQCTSTCN